jgi:hypothetical protein
MLEKLKTRANESVHIAPLAVLRIAFAAILFISIARFILKGWITDFYITPKFYFTFYGFEWVRPLGASGMYILFGVMLLTSLLITLGLFYRISITVFFLCFTYTELIDKTYYLNHYYFISIMTFLMMLVPAHRYFSLDVLRKPSLKISHVPAWTIWVFKLQLILVYFFAGISKLNYDWLINAMPLKIWLPANYHLPLIGSLLTQEWIAYFFSWFGAAFDLCICFFLLNGRVRKYAYFILVLFHIFTAWFFKIGMFPYVMIFVTLIFFSEDFHKDLIGKMGSLFKRKEDKPEIFKQAEFSPMKSRFIYSLLLIYFTLQILIPFRYILYPGVLFWTEEGYRFSWRVMLMEKGGTAFFYVHDPETGKKMEIPNSQFLTPMQERMLTTQPDMILQYAHFLDKEFRRRGIKDPVVTVEDYVTLNGSGSRLFIDKTVDLSKQEEGFFHKPWILPFNKTN